MSEKAELAIEVAGASVANKTTAVGAAAGAYGYLVDINWIGLIGVAIAVLGYLTNLYFQKRRENFENIERQERNRREEAIAAAKIAMYERGGESVQ